MKIRRWHKIKKKITIEISSRYLENLMINHRKVGAKKKKVLGMQCFQHVEIITKLQNKK